MVHLFKAFFIYLVMMSLAAFLLFVGVNSCTKAIEPLCPNGLAHCAGEVIANTATSFEEGMNSTNKNEEVSDAGHSR